MSRTRVFCICVVGLQTVLDSPPFPVSPFSFWCFSILLHPHLPFGPFPLAFTSWLWPFSFPLFPPVLASHGNWDVGWSHCVLSSCGCDSFPLHKNSSYLNFPAVWILAKWDLLHPRIWKHGAHWSWHAYLSLLLKTSGGRYFNKSADAFKTALLSSTYLEQTAYILPLARFSPVM